MKLSQIAKWAALAFILWWVIQQPTHAAHLVQNIGNFLSDAAHGLSNFFTSI